MKALLFLILSAALPLAASPLLTIDSPVQTIPAGASAGFGFAGTSTDNWAVLTAAYLCDEGTFSQTTCTTPGTFSDYVSLNFYFFGPGSPLTQPFDQPATQGIGLFTPFNTVVPGDIIHSNLYVLFDQYDGDPTAGGNQIFPPTGEVFVFGTPVTITIEGVPEPATWLLTAGALVVFGRLRRRT